MAAEFDIARIADLLRLEEVRANDSEARATRFEGTSPDEAAALRTAAYWHRRTAKLIGDAVPAARGWTGRGHKRQEGT